MSPFVFRRILIGSAQSTSSAHSDQIPEMCQTGSDDEENENEVIVVVETEDVPETSLAAGRGSPEAPSGTFIVTFYYSNRFTAKLSVFASHSCKNSCSCQTVIAI